VVPPQGKDLGLFQQEDAASVLIITLQNVLQAGAIHMWAGAWRHAPAGIMTSSGSPGTRQQPESHRRSVVAAARKASQQHRLLTEDAGGEQWNDSASHAKPQSEPSSSGMPTMNSRA